MVVHGALKTVYSYLGYYNVCHLGGEIRNPQTNIPRSIFISILVIAALYLLMNVALAGVMTPQEVAAADKYVVSSFMAKLYGQQAAVAVTVLILCIAMSSLFAVILGYSRVPYAAAVDGNFFRVFGRLHPTKDFPYISLIVLCALGFLFSLLFKLKDVITAILAMRILVQFVAQAVGVTLLRRQSNGHALPFKMWLFPLPVIISVIIWLFLFISTGWFAIWGLIMALLGVAVFYLFRRQDGSTQA
jgi:amino acid transporter